MRLSVGRNQQQYVRTYVDGVRMSITIVASGYYTPMSERPAASSQAVKQASKQAEAHRETMTPASVWSHQGIRTWSGVVVLRRHSLSIIDGL